MDDEVTEARLADHRDNLARLDAMLPGYAGNIDPARFLLRRARRGS